MASVKNNKLKVGVIFGGRSGEHEVSLISATSVISALDPNKYDVVPIGITKQGTWNVGVSPQMMLSNQNHDKNSTRLAFESCDKASLTCDPSYKGLVLLEKPKKENQIELDVLFPITHGTYGEDGTLQGMLELAGIPYVGCGVLASAVGMDKTFAKRLFRDAGIKISPFIEILRSDWRKNKQATINKIVKQIGIPCFIKPVNSGSSVGISKVTDVNKLTKALNLASEYDRKILVETCITGREIEVSVLGNDEPIASVPGEIVPCNDFYDYNAKYVDNKSELKIPADLSPEIIKSIRNLAIKAYKALDCSGMARVDFFLEKDTNCLIINEINTIPGFTSVSMYPKLWEATGITYSELVDKLIEFAIDRYNDNQESLSAVA